jgi:hypothetical protein
MRLMVKVFLVFCALGTTQVSAQSVTADERASCNASFHSGCAKDSATGVSSSGFAAPMGLIGSSAQECASLAVMLAVVAWLSRRRRKAGRDASPMQETREGYQLHDSPIDPAHPAREE